MFAFIESKLVDDHIIILQKATVTDVQIPQIDEENKTNGNKQKSKGITYTPK